MHGLKVVYSVSPTSVASFINVSNTGINEYQNLHNKSELAKDYEVTRDSCSINLCNKIKDSK